MEILFSPVEAIKERRSVRTYAERPIEKDKLDGVLKFASELTNPLNIKGIDITLTRTSDVKGEKLGTYGVIKGANTFLGLAVEPEQNAMVMAGYEMETLILYATSVGLGTVWLGGTFRRDKFASALALDSTKILPAITPIGYPEKPRVAERLMRKVAKSDQRKPWSALFYDRNVDTPLTPEAAGSCAELLEMVRLAPSATNSQPWRVVKDGDAYHFYCYDMPQPGKAEYNMRCLDMGIALCHFMLTAQAKGVACAFAQQSPDIAVPDSYTYMYSLRVN